jgi:AraC-like DNA-binding protein
MASAKFKIIPAPEGLQRDIECFRLSTYPRPGEVAIRVCPNTNPGIVFQQYNGESTVKDIVTDSGRVVHVPTLFMHGQVTELSVMHFDAPYSTIQVILRPYALSTLFGLDASTLTNNSIGAQAFGGKALNQALLLTDIAEAQLDLLTDFLLAQQVASGHRDAAIEEVIDFIDKHIAEITVEKLSAHSGLSERQLLRKFKQTVGIAPQVYMRIRRINEAFRLMDSGKYERLADIAHTLNFHDQSHFIRDIKAFSGVTPKSILQKVNGFHHDQVSSSYTDQ